MKKQYQVTLLSTTGKYRPVSAIIEAENMDITISADHKKLVEQGIKKICSKRLWGNYELKTYGYTRAKIREYDKAKIDAENKARYEAIKEAKYVNGEWKRPKSKKGES